MSSRYAEASLRIVADTKAYETKIREMGGFTEKEINKEVAAFKKGEQAREKAAQQAAASITIARQKESDAAKKAMRDEMAAWRKATDAQLADRNRVEAATGRASKQIDGLAKSMRIALPAVGQYGERLGGLARIMEEGFTPAAAAASGMVGALVAGFAALGAMALSTAANIDEIEKSLGYINGDSELAGAVASAHKFNDETKQLKEHWTELSTILSGRVLVVLDPIQRKIDEAVQSLMWLMDRQGYAQREADKAMGDTLDPSTWQDQGFTDLLAANTANIAKPKESPAKPSGNGSRRASSVSIASSDAAKKAADEAAEYERIIGETLDQWKEEERASHERVNRMAEDQAQIDAMLKASHDAERQRMADEAAAWKSLQTEKVGAAEDMASSLSNVIGLVGDMWAQSTDDASEAAKRQAKITKVLASFQLAADLAKAIGAAMPWASASGPAAPAAIAAIFGSMTAIFADIATMIGPVPSFHTGGTMQPDESYAKVKRGEVIVSAPEVASVGGPRAVRDRMRGGGAPDMMPLLSRIARTLDRIDAKTRPAAPLRAWSA